MIRTRKRTHSFLGELNVKSQEKEGTILVLRGVDEHAVREGAAPRHEMLGVCPKNLFWRNSQRCLFCLPRPLTNVFTIRTIRHIIKTRLL